MRRGGALLLGLWAGLVAGCVTGPPAPPTAWLQALKSPQGPDVVHIETALLEVAPGDRFLNGELWTLADDQVLAPDQKVLLEANGLRVGQLGGVMPAELQTLLTARRTWGNPQRIQQHAGQPVRVVLGPVQARCCFQVHREERDAPVNLEQAECVLVLVPSLAADGRTRLQLTPEIRHGPAALMPYPTADRSRWMVQKQQPTESYPDLGCEVSLAAGEYLIVGGRIDRPETLGYQAFVRGEEATPRQRLLLIRTARPASGSVADGNTAPTGTEADPAFERSPPLALQAVLSSHRP
jgi:hypothetical protein